MLPQLFESTLLELAGKLGYTGIQFECFAEEAILYLFAWFQDQFKWKIDSGRYYLNISEDLKLHKLLKNALR